MTPPCLRTRILVGPALRAQPDRRLVVLAREGHEPAIEEIVRRYRPALVRYAATIVPPDRADDVVQDSIARALPKIREGEGDLHLRPWLYTIVRNTSLNNLRDAGPPFEHLDENYDGVEQPPQAMERREELAAMVAGVKGLPEAQRRALVGREIEGRSHAEIGASLGVSVGAARQLIHRGRITLREGLGALIPLPVVRQLLEGINGPAAAGAGAGGAVAAKAAVALLAAGGVVTAGVALDRHSHSTARAEPVIAKAGGGEEGPPGAGATGPAASSGQGSPDAEAGAKQAQGAGNGAGEATSGLRSTGSSGSGPGGRTGSESGDNEGGEHNGEEADHGGEHQGDGGGGDEGGGSGHEGPGGGSEGHGGGDEGPGAGGGDDGPGGGSEGHGGSGEGSGGGGEGGGGESGGGEEPPSEGSGSGSGGLGSGDGEQPDLPERD